MTIEILSPDGEVYRQQPDGSIFIGNPKLWWPNGYGEQPLYTVKAVLTADGREVDTWEKKIGLPHHDGQYREGRVGQLLCP